MRVLPAILLASRMPCPTWHDDYKSWGSSSNNSRKLLQQLTPLAARFQKLCILPRLTEDLPATNFAMYTAGRQLWHERLAVRQRCQCSFQQHKPEREAAFA